MSTLRVNNLDARTGTTISVPSGTSMYLPGHIVQVINTHLTTTSTVSMSAGASATTDITGLSATITPKSTSSKIYMTVRWFGEFGTTDGAYNAMFGIKRNGSPLGLVTNTFGFTTAAQSYTYTDASSTPEMLFMDYYDSPASVSALTYQVYVGFLSSSQTLYTNRTVSDSGSGASTGYERGTSSITLFEIAG